MSRGSFTVVQPRHAEGMNVSLTLNLGGLGPKWTISCGNCPGTFRARLPLVDKPTVPCPYCGAFNRLPVVYESGL